MGEVTFFRSLLVEGGHASEGGVWVYRTWTVVLEVHWGLLTSVSHDGSEG